MSFILNIVIFSCFYVSMRESGLQIATVKHITPTVADSRVHTSKPYRLPFTAPRVAKWGSSLHTGIVALFFVYYLSACNEATGYSSSRGKHGQTA